MIPQLVNNNNIDILLIVFICISILAVGALMAITVIMLTDEIKINRRRKHWTQTKSRKPYRK